MRPKRWFNWLVPTVVLAIGLLGCRGKIDGVVKDREGKAVPGALVAIVPAAANRETQLVESDREGRFSVQGLAKGSYALTATAPGRVAAYHEPIQVRARSVQHVELEMAGEALTLRGSLADPTGRPLGNVIIRALRFSSSVGDVFVTKSGASGGFALVVPKGKYILTLEAADLGADPKTIFGASENKPFHGNRCASITRDESPWRWGYGMLYQNLDPAKYRGKRIRFRAAARGEISGIGNRVELFVSVFPAKSNSSASALSFVSTMDSPIESDAWQFLQVDTAVAPQADSISVGFILAGNGRAWFDDASVEVLDATTASQ